jgi:hypothetical protein
MGLKAARVSEEAIEKDAQALLAEALAPVIVREPEAAE